MRVIFVGDPIEIERGEGLSRLSTELYGVKFPMSAEVDVSHLPDKLKQKLLNNPHFLAVGVDAPVPPLIIPAGAESAALDDEEAAEAAAHKERAAKRKAKAA